MKIRLPVWIVCLVAGLSLTACFERSASPPTMAEIKSETRPDREGWGVLLDLSENGIPRARISAATMASYESEDSTYSHLRSNPATGQRVTVWIFDRNGDSTATVTTDELFHYESDDRYEAHGNVIVVTRENRRLESEHILWFQDQQKIRTPDFVRITTPDQRIQGYQLDADEDLKPFTLARPTGIVTYEEE